MKFSVLVVLPAQEPLRDLATASLRGRRSVRNLKSVAMPRGFELDKSFGAVAIGSAESGFTTIAALKPAESKDFVVRGTIEAESPEEIPVGTTDRPIFADPQIAPFPYCSGAAQGTVVDVRTKLDVSGLAAKGLDGDKIAIAIMDSGINLAHLTTKLGAPPRLDVSNSWTPANSTTLPGQYPVDHGTMCAYDALIAAPKATLIDYPVLRANAPGGNVTGGTISVALQAFAHLLANYAVAYAPGGLPKYNGIVVNNSWGIYHPTWDFPAGHPGRYCDNPNHPFAAIVTALVNAGVDVLFAAGNCGSNCPDGRCQGKTTGTIMGANAYANVMTLAACLATNDDRLGYSSQGPSIVNMPQQKPDLTAYSHFVGSEAGGVGRPDSGTSTACPVAAGCVAAIRTKLPHATCPPVNLIQQFQMSARTARGSANGWNADFGHGIIEPVATASSLGL